MPHEIAWAILLVPLAAFVIISLVIRPFFNRLPKLSGYIAIGAITLSLAFSLWALADVADAPGHRLEMPDIEWLVIGDSLKIHLGLIMDSLTVVMLVVVTVVSLMVQIYSLGYMRGDPGYHRYYAFMSLFTASMLGLVMADNLLFLYVFWEGVGVCSYFLIGFWFHRPAAANAAKKAFIVTRLGDLGLLIAILFLFSKTGTFDIVQLHADIPILLATGVLSSAALTWVAIGIFAGAVGKSAQFPLHVWLPDAMEGPTPVSALIHAATMVAAGVFLVARMFPIFTAPGAEDALFTVALIGGFTAIFAASMGLVMNDIKRVLAYSTISQLGYMMLSLGAFGYAAAIFHLFTHAFFKALLFLGAGSVGHATGTFDMREMGGLRKAMPWTYATFLVASLSIAGIWPLAGFWSKDEVLAQAWDERRILFFLGMITVFMTAFYMFRAVFLTFGGKYRGKEAGGEHEEGHGSHLHESPLVMVAPMVLLAILAVVSGWFNFIGDGFAGFLALGKHPEEVGFISALAHPLPWVSMILAGLGIYLAYAMYSAKRLSAEAVGRRFAPLYKLFSRKYWFDELYERVIVSRVLVGGLFSGLSLFDTYAVDGVVNGVADGTVAASRAVRRVQTGQLQVYGLATFVGILLIMGGFYLFGR
ncbi:MAG: NADH-quinone oxidoreductase subunit L [Dehalococcoidia bacterium]